MVLNYYYFLKFLHTLKCQKFRTLDCFRENPSRIKVRLKKKHEAKQDNNTQKLYSNFSKDFARMKNKSIQKFHLNIKICLTSLDLRDVDTVWTLILYLIHYKL